MRKHPCEVFLKRFLRLIRLPFLAVLLALTGSDAQATPSTQAGPYRVELTTEPATIPVGKAKLRLKITDASSKPVGGATVKTFVTMPGMNMGEREQPAIPQPGESGVYVSPAAFPMAGPYRADIKINGPQGEAATSINLQTGQNTMTAGGGSPLPRVLLWGGVLALAAFILYRMRRTGQRIEWRGLFSRPVLGGLAVLLVMLVVVVFAVRKWRRPGAMTPLEAQGMEMNMPAPPGAMPVTLAVVRRGPVTSTVRYTGQVVGYIEQEVYPRISGNLLWMPFYTGNRVRKGQLLARLDTSQIEPQVAQQRATEAMARQNAISSQGEYRQALADINRARAEVAARRGALAEAISNERKARAQVGVRIAQLNEARSGQRKAYSTAGGRRSAVAEARSGERKARAALQETTAALRSARAAAAAAQSDLAAAREDKAGAQADLDAAQTQVSDAEAQLQAAEADQEYWQKEIARMRVLVQEGAVSREEFQREQAQYENAVAKVRQATARIKQVQAEVRGAQSRIRRADAMIRSAQSKTEGAGATIEGNLTRIEQARADIVGAAARTRQLQAEAEGAGADISGAGARIQQMQEDVRAARAETASAAARIEQVRAEIEAAESGVRAAQAQAAAARGGVGQAQAGIAQAQAGVAAVTTTRGYTQIRSLVDGVVTQRLISPGTLVQPGQGILRVAQISPIRLQANVAEVDLKRVRVGSIVTVRDRSGAGKGGILTARVTSAAPAVDPQTRTGLVEAVVPNSDERFLPGEFIEMEIEIGQSRSNLSVPSTAIQKRVTTGTGVLSTRTQSYVWVAEPVSGQTNQFSVQQVAITTGVSDGEVTEILSGLREGQRVVTMGYQSLKDGDTVATPETMMAGSPSSMAKMEGSSQSASVAVNEQGYEPATLTLKAGVPARVTFTRKTDATCGTEVLFPDFGIKETLPLNQPVIVEFTPRKGEYSFTCGMNMLKGKVVVR